MHFLAGLVLSLACLAHAYCDGSQATSGTSTAVNTDGIPCCPDALLNQTQLADLIASRDMHPQYSTIDVAIPLEGTRKPAR